MNTITKLFERALVIEYLIKLLDDTSKRQGKDKCLDVLSMVETLDEMLDDIYAKLDAMGGDAYLERNADKVNEYLKARGYKRKSEVQS